MGATGAKAERQLSHSHLSKRVSSQLPPNSNKRAHPELKTTHSLKPLRQTPLLSPPLSSDVPATHRSYKRHGTAHWSYYTVTKPAFKEPPTQIHILPLWQVLPALPSEFLFTFCFVGSCAPSAPSLSLFQAATDAGLQEGMSLLGPAVTSPVQFHEHGLTFEADVIRGQKTGHFLDQRDNRKTVGLIACSAPTSSVSVRSVNPQGSVMGARGGPATGSAFPRRTRLAVYHICPQLLTVSGPLNRGKVHATFCVIPFRAAFRMRTDGVIDSYAVPRKQENCRI